MDKYRETIVIVKKFEIILEFFYKKYISEISLELSVLRSPESKKVVFTKCLSVCPYPELQQKLLYFDFDQIWYIYVDWALIDARREILKYPKN